MSEARFDLRRLVSQRHVVEVLDVLAAGPMTVAQMRAVLPRGRRDLSRALRELLVSGLVTADRPGSRDDVAPAGERYHHTESGQAVIGLLSTFSVWRSLYDE